MIKQLSRRITCFCGMSVKRQAHIDLRARGLVCPRRCALARLYAGGQCESKQPLGLLQPLGAIQIRVCEFEKNMVVSLLLSFTYVPSLCRRGLPTPQMLPEIFSSIMTWPY